MELNLNREEKTVLTDATNWYIDYTKDSMFVEELTEEEKTELKRLISELNKNSKCILTDDLCNTIMDDILPNFGRELKEHINNSDVENKQKTGNFYRVQFNNIDTKINELKKEQNPFF